MYQNDVVKHFLQNLPHRSYSTDNFKNVKIRYTKNALKYRYMQLNPPAFNSFLIFDIDPFRIGI
jgi:hypothetical protein